MKIKKLGKEKFIETLDEINAHIMDLFINFTKAFENSKFSCNFLQSQKILLKEN